MVAVTQGKRKIVVAGRKFLWVVRQDEYARHPAKGVLTVLSEDKRFHVTYELGQHLAVETPCHPGGAPSTVTIYRARAESEIMLYVVGPSSMVRTVGSF